MTPRSCHALCAAALLLNAIAASAQEAPAPPAPSEAALNAAWAQRLVRVRAGEVEGLGVFFGPAKHVLTAYRLINRGGELRVAFGNGALSQARVVGWDAASGLALLELADAPPVVPAPLAARVPQIGDSVLSPDLVASAIVTGDGVPTVTAVLGAGRVSGRLDESLWVDLPLSHDDLGRPIVTPDGALLGVVIEDADATAAENTLSWRSSRARVAGPGALAAFAAQPRTAGTFEPDSHHSWGALAGLLVVPVASDGVQGGAMQFGYRYDWFVFLVREGFAMTGFAPKAELGFERIQQRFFFEAELEAQFDVFSRSALWLGVGGVYFADSILRRELDGGGGFSDSERSDRRVRPLFGFGINAGFVEFAVHGYYDDGLAGRIGLGFMLGRR